MNRQSGGYERPREARLRPEAAQLYPGIAPDIWCQAASMADRVWSLRLRRGEGAVRLTERVLDPDHFEFRNRGETAPGPANSHRATDQQRRGRESP
jgi:hypothetical protein